ncbi:hypothetical protein SAY86_007210 [Trapa natans]|uniref:Terpene synthase metal-binding domain-containing protein n=1 Tax=Trapa natans TaxID=22666 RepID=A0AAN7QZY8_TRANT|nr:hypothetical protein SAY86_007210 [Trapa natans]
MMDRLPDYMQVFYKELLHFFDEIKQQLVHTEGLSSRMYYAKESVKLQARAYLKEAEWLNQKKIPTLEEYLFVSLTSVGIAMLMAISFLGMGDITTEHAYKWILSSQNETVKASSLICRLTNDIAGHKFEQGRDHVASAVQCFMKQHGVTEQAAVEELWKKVDDGWKDLNEECFQPRPVPTQVLTRILNITRSLSLFYKDDTDVYTHSDLKMKQQVAELLVDPIPM